MTSNIARQLFLAGLVASALVGCAKEPNHAVENVGARDQNSDTGMTEPVPIEYLDDLVAEASQWLAADLPNQPAIKAAKFQYVFAVPKTLTNDLNLPDGRLRQTLNRLQAELQQSQAFNDAFIVISATQLDAQKDINSVAGGDTSAFRDPLQHKADKTKAETYDPQYIYTMDGKFYQSVDYATKKRSFHLFIRINAPQSRQSILDRDFVYNLKWNSKKGKWERDA